ncbi:MAG: hypothetical protein CM1200mP15_23040 [Dehalococcoidia bacterium]|nr:MAG: hypothetical protein CM1200mP15_23040 [Dehalococcoidia bacterium]
MSGLSPQGTPVIQMILTRRTGELPTKGAMQGDAVPQYKNY